MTKKKKNLYVSLYGITTFAEIDDIFFRQLHPVLSSKGMAITGKVLKGLLKTTLKIDLGDDSNGNASISSQIPDIDLPDYLKQTDDCILFFDDLERCKISIENILGYINYFVEHDGLKTIIIANEDEILQRQDDIYNRIKEKLIGKTFEIVPDLNPALKNFIKSTSNDRVREFLYQEEDSIKHLYSTSKYKNLRQLKQIIWDFERLYHFLPHKAKNSEPLLQEVLKIFVALSFEIKRGSLQPGEIGRLQEVEYFNLFLSDKQEDKKDNHLLQIIEKYQNLSFQDLVLGGQCWHDFFDKGIIEKTLIEKGVANSIFFRDENTANWVKLWHYNNLEDDEFQRLLDQVEKEFNNLEYKEIGVILHIVGLFLRFSSGGDFSFADDASGTGPSLGLVIK